MKVVGVIVAALVVVLALSWVFAGNDLFLYRYFAPKQAAVQRQVFEETKSYNQGMIQELQNMQFQYEQAADAHKAALASVILHRTADYDETKLPRDLYAFVQRLRRDR